MFSNCASSAVITHTTNGYLSNRKDRHFHFSWDATHFGLLSEFPWEVVCRSAGLRWCCCNCSCAYVLFLGHAPPHALSPLVLPIATRASDIVFAFISDSYANDTSTPPRRRKNSTRHVLFPVQVKESIVCSNLKGGRWSFGLVSFFFLTKLLQQQLPILSYSPCQLPFIATEQHVCFDFIRSPMLQKRKELRRRWVLLRRFDNQWVGGDKYTGLIWFSVGGMFKEKIKIQLWGIHSQLCFRPSQFSCRSLSPWKKKNYKGDF